jgi:hypothetical protein
MATVPSNDPAHGKVALDDGVIFMMTGGSIAHAGVAAHLIASLLPRLRGTG